MLLLVLHVGGLTWRGNHPVSMEEEDPEVDIDNADPDKVFDIFVDVVEEVVEEDIYYTAEEDNDPNTDTTVNS